MTDTELLVEIIKIGMTFVTLLILVFELGQKSHK